MKYPKNEIRQTPNLESQRRDILRLFALMLLLAGLFATTQFPVSAQSGRKPKKESADPKHKTVDPNAEEESNKSAKPLADNTPVIVGEDGTIKMDTAMVTIPATVIDRSGKFVATLKRRDFELYEDGVKQEIEHLRPVEEPFNVVLLLDTSESTAFRHEDIQQAAYEFVTQLRPTDKVMVVSFDSQIEVWCEFTNSRETIRNAIFRVNRGGNTRLYDSIDLVVNDELKKVQGRKAVVLFSDGWDTASRYTAKRALELVEESDAMFYTIFYDTGDANQTGPTISNPYPGGGGNGGGGPRTPPIGGPTPPTTRRPGSRIPFITYQLPGQNRSSGRMPSAEAARGRQFMTQLADRSGARFYEADTLGNLSRAYAEIAADLRKQYAISYYPTNTAEDGSYRRVKVRISPSSQYQDVIIRARDGYRAGSKTKQPETDNGRKRPTLKRRTLAPDTVSDNKNY